MKNWITLIFLLLSSNLAAQQNLVINGDFESGNSGFESEYKYINGTPADGAMEYFIYHDAGKLRYQWKATGKGNFMIVDGDDKATTFFWKENIATRSKKDYLFKFSITAMYDATTYSRAQIGLFVNDKKITTFNSPARENYWEQMECLVPAVQTGKMDIKLVVLNPSWSGNDFAIDNISLTEIKPGKKVKVLKNNDMPDSSVYMPTINNTVEYKEKQPPVEMAAELVFPTEKLQEEISITTDKDIILSVENENNELLFQNVSVTAGKAIIFPAALKFPKTKLYLVSHSSSNTTIKITIGSSTQSVILNALQRSAFKIMR
jgi:hypothetical protein